MLLSRAKRATLGAAGIIVVVAVAVSLLWHDRPSLDSIVWPSPTVATSVDAESVSVTWLGVTTLLIDDGVTQILIDGYISRPTLLDIVLGRPVMNDVVNINFAMNEFRMRRLAAIIPVHSHFDHAMDIGAIANRSSASILGSESTAQIARGAGVPADQITIVEHKASFSFGNFKVTLLPSSHAPIGWRGAVPYDGTIESPLVLPQPTSAWRMGGSYSIVIAHPQGTLLVQGSAGFSDGALEEISADVVLLGVGRLGSLGKQYAESYWQNIVTATGARSVYPIHFDDLTQPFGQVVLWPKIMGNFETMAAWLEDFRNRWDTDTTLYLPEFGKPIAIFSQAEADT